MSMCGLEAGWSGRVTSETRRLDKEVIWELGRNLLPGKLPGIHKDDSQLQLLAMLEGVLNWSPTVSKVVTSPIAIRVLYPVTNGSRGRDPHISTVLSSESVKEEREEGLYLSGGHDGGTHRDC